MQQHADVVHRGADDLRDVGGREFLDLPEDDGSGKGAWIERASALSHGLPKQRAPELPADERARLEHACAAAMKLVGR